jgi:endonuclease-3
METLLAVYPEARTLLEHGSCYQLLIAVILSSQTTDAQVNRVTPVLFRRFPLPADLAAADQGEVEEIVRSTGFYRVKARHIIGAAAALSGRFSSVVPSAMEELLSLPGLGRKGANVIAGNCFGQPAVIVDTHFGRVVRRLGMTGRQNPEQVEREIRGIIPVEKQTHFSMAANLHGRDTCRARVPLCGACAVREWCNFFNDGRHAQSPAGS